MTFQPDDAALPGSGLFGLATRPEDAAFVVIPVPFDATTSYRDGARLGPAAVLEASRQVDLYDVDFGRPWRGGIAMLPLRGAGAARLARLSRTARRHAAPVIAAAGRVEGRPRLARALDAANRIGDEVNALVDRAADAALAAGKTPVVLGGDHASPFGAIRACARRHPGLGILHVDAHADLRDAYEGFAWSHASIMHNVVHRLGAAGGVAALVQFGIRDVGEGEVEAIRRHRTPAPGRTRIVTHFDADIQGAKLAGRSFRARADRAVRDLPRDVYLSFDIDGLDPALCPDTGTPVPGGLSFAELVELLRAVVRAKRRIVGMDLCEVAPSPRTPRSALGTDWNGNVGARVLYKMIGAAAASGRPGSVTRSAARRSG